MNIKRQDPMSSKPGEACAGPVLSSVNPVRDESGMFPEDAEKLRTSDVRHELCFELVALRSLLEKIACVCQEDSAWTWDHEKRSFLLQAPDHIIEQYSSILTRELGQSLCLHVKRATIIIELWPWKKVKDRTSLRIGFKEDDIPDELRGHTNLDGLINLHFVSRPNNPQYLRTGMARFKLMCTRIDALLEKKYEWMWETYWRADGMAFAVVQKEMWMDKSVLVEREIEQFNNSPAAQQASLRIELRTYDRGSSFNVRIALEGWPSEPRHDPRILPVFDAHFSDLITRK